MIAPSAENAREAFLPLQRTSFDQNCHDGQSRALMIGLHKKLLQKLASDKGSSQQKQSKHPTGQ